MKRLPTARAFTLTELVILIGIGVLLVALSLAGSAKARESSVNAKCMGNLRSVFVGLTNFINDRGYYPGMRVTTRPTTWHHALEPYVTGLPVPSSGAPASPWAMCPGKQKTPAGPLGYGYNQYFGNIPPNASDASPTSAFNDYWQLRPSQVNHPSTKIVIGDGRDDNVTSGFTQNALRNSTNPLDELHPRRHYGGGNFLFADGHIERMTPQELVDRIRRADPEVLKPF